MESQLRYNTSFRNNLRSSNLTTDSVNTTHAVSVFGGCEQMVSGIIFDLTMQSFNVIIGIPANILVLANLIKTRKEPLTSDLFLGCLAFVDAYFGFMTIISFLNLYHWGSAMAWMALKFSYGVKDTSGPLFLSCVCLDRFIAVLFPLHSDSWRTSNTGSAWASWFCCSLLLMLRSKPLVESQTLRKFLLVRSC